jgi:hypothetical protein
MLFSELYKLAISKRYWRSLLSVASGEIRLITTGNGDRGRLPNLVGAVAQVEQC